MAGNDQRKRIMGAGAGGRSDRGRIAGGLRHGGVAARLAIGDVAQPEEHRAAEPVRELQVDRQRERTALAGEVLVELAGSLVEPARRAQDPRADGARQARKDRIVILAVERHTHEALCGRREEERSERAVHRAIRHVQSALAFRKAGEVVVEGCLVASGKRALESIDDLLVGGHGLLLERRLRRFAIPSDTLRRAAVVLDPRSSPTSAYESPARYR